MIVFPNAKINIGLQVLNKRSDGYHNIETVFYPIAWNDILEILPQKTGETEIIVSGTEIKGDISQNLCFKAWKLLHNQFQIPSVYIHLHKIIPMGAGLGGGSSDGAFTLMALNTLFELGLSKQRLKEFALELGSDCPFFIENKPTLATGRGEILQEQECDLKGKYLVVVYPNIFVSTADAFKGITPNNNRESIKNLITLPIENWKNELKNDFEKQVFSFYPSIFEIKNNLYNLGAIYASLSGSGSAVYGIFDKKPKDLSNLSLHYFKEIIL